MPEVRLNLPCFTQLPSLDNLTGLDVSRNRLKAPPDVSSLSALSSLDIGHNRATSLPEAYLDGVPAALESLGLHGFELTADEIVTAKTRLTALSELSADAAVALSTTELDVTEGQSVQYRLVLAAPPESAVTVIVASSDAAVAVSPTPLTFTDWGVPATLTVAAPQDTDADDAAATVSHRATGDTVYAAIAIDTARVAVADDDSTPAAPPAPALTGGDAKITAAWAAPAAGLLNGGPTPTTGYQTRYRPSGGEWSVPTAAAGTTATIAGLANNTAHQVQVRALNIADAGPWSPAATATPAATPGAPTRLAATAQLAHGNTLRLHLAWTPPAGTVTGYRIQYKQHTATDWTDWPHTGTANTATIAPAPPHAAPLAGTTIYDIRVAALNQQTPGPYTTITTTPTN